MTGQAEDRFWVSRVRVPTKQSFFARHLVIVAIFPFFRPFFWLFRGGAYMKSAKSGIPPKKYRFSDQKFLFSIKNDPFSAFPWAGDTFFGKNAKKCPFLDVFLGGGVSKMLCRLGMTKKSAVFRVFFCHFFHFFLSLFQKTPLFDRFLGFWPKPSF